MLLKRKRSSSEFSYPSQSPCSTSAVSSPLRRPCDPPVVLETSPCPKQPFAFASHFGAAVARPTWSSPSPHSPSGGSSQICMPGRTFKRSRDNRPPEQEVHERTMKMLFNAQQHVVDTENMHEVEVENEGPSTSGIVETNTHAPNQISLHKFWNIQSKPQQITPDVIDKRRPESPHCEDCGRDLRSDGNMELDGAEEDSCGACGKTVCFSCSISNLGEQKRCLVCAHGRPMPVDAGRQAGEMMVF